jgi:hypothetical protein
MEITQMTFEECCKRVIKAADASKPGALIHYGATYARAGLKMTDAEEIRVQALYIRSNLSAWSGAEAREVKAALDKIGKAKR